MLLKLCAEKLPCTLNVRTFPARDLVREEPWDIGRVTNGDVDRRLALFWLFWHIEDGCVRLRTLRHRLFVIGARIDQRVRKI